MRSFFQTAYTAFASGFVYRANTALGVLGRLVRISVPLFVWSALYGASGETVINGRTLGDRFGGLRFDDRKPDAHRRH